ncbi:MAG TPA: tetratricopeptide repeat protein [Blastocatellia bacterium]|nr:tetratricopeptide repeat protein [Blastocatellia bacterium]
MPLIICFGLTNLAQTKDEARPLEPGQIMEREIAGGHSHAYQITLAAGQFIRIVVEQKGVDVALTLAVPDGQPAQEINLTGVGGQESLSHIATQNGRHQIMARAATPSAAAGLYQIRLELRDTATDQDRRRIAAEQLLIEASRLRGEATIDKLQQALGQWRELGDRRWEVFALHRLGEAYRLLGRFQESLERAEQALAVSRQIEDRHGESAALTVLGIDNSMMGRREQAVEYFERALAIRREAKMRVGEAQSLGHLGTTYNLMGRYDSAIEYLEQALTISRELKIRQNEGAALHNLGENYLKTSRFEKAIESFEAALSIHRESKDRFSEGTTLASLGAAKNVLGRNDQAIEYFEQALQIRRELRDRNGEGNSLNALGAIHRDMGRHEKASEYLEQALQIGREVKNRAMEMATLTFMSSVAFTLGQRERAIELAEQALRICREIKSPAEAEVLNNLGNAFTFLGRYERGLEYYSLALALHRKTKARTSEAIVLGNMSIVYLHLGLVDKAIGCVEESLAIRREVKYRDGEALALHNLGEIYQTQGRSEPAMERFEQALAIFREVKNRTMEGTALGKIGEVRLSLARPENAIRYFEQALAINREVGDRPGEGSTLSGLGQAYQSLRQIEKAVSHFQQALAVHREVKDRPTEVQTLHNYAKAELDRGDLDRSRALIEECLQITESLRTDIYNTERRDSYFASAQGAYEFYIDLLMRLHRANPGRGYDALAVEATERSRARGLVEMLRESGADIRQGVDRSLIERERALAWQINAKAQQLTQRLPREQVAALNGEISRLEEEYQQTQTAIRRASPRYNALTSPQPLKLAEMQRQLDDQTILLEFSLGAERSFLWAVTKNSLSSFELPKRERIEQGARRVYDLLTARSRGPKGETPSQRRARLAEAERRFPSAARQLSQMLLSPVAAELGKKRLVVVADGALQYLPFAMLPEPTTGRRGDGETGRGVSDRPVAQSPGRPVAFTPLVVNHEVISMPSVSALAALRQEQDGRKPAPNNVALIADPVFAASDERVKIPDLGVSSQPSQKDETKGAPQTDTPDASIGNTRIIEHLAGNSGNTKAGMLFIPRLPFTRQEADRIIAVASATPGATNLSALDFKANRATATGADLSQYRYIHFATHGLLDSERPGLSSLALSMVDEQGKPQDGFLRAHEIYNLNLPAELVVLSACQTGLGKEIKGEGLVGMTRGFMYAGAARVVVSLWNVNDKATAELMSKFYQKMFKDGQRPAAALRSAQIEMLRSFKWQSPYYWSAFTLQGEWR